MRPQKKSTLSLALRRRLSSLKELKEAIANILDLNASTLRILSVKKGCVEVTLLIPAEIADVMFTSTTKLTPEQKQKLRAAFCDEV